MCPIPDKFLSIGEKETDFTRLSVTLHYYSTPGSGGKVRAAQAGMDAQLRVGTRD